MEDGGGSIAWRAPAFALLIGLIVRGAVGLTRRTVLLEAVRRLPNVVIDEEGRFTGNYSGAPGNGQRLSTKDSNQGSKHHMPLLAHGGEIAANATKGGQSQFTAKGA